MPRHVGRPGRHFLRRHRWGGHDEHFRARQQAGQAHLDVTGPRRKVDQEIVQITPVGILEELLDGPVEDEATPHDRLLLVGQEAHRQDAERARPDLPFERDHLAETGFDVTLHAEQARHRETPDVRIEHADHVAAGGQGDGQVDGDRRLAHATLARRDGEDPGAGRDGRFGRLLPGLPPRPGHHGRPLVGIHGGHVHVDGAHPVEGLHVAHHVFFDLRPQRAGGDGQSHVHHDVACMLVDGPDHPQIHDGVPQLGVDHPTQAFDDRVLAGRAGRDPGRNLGDVIGGDHGEDFTWVQVNSRLKAPWCGQAGRPGSIWVSARTVRRERPRPRAVPQRGGSSDDSLHVRQHREEAGTGVPQ